MSDINYYRDVKLKISGPYASATRAKLEEMKAAALTHIVCVRQSLEKNLIRPNHPEHFKYLVVEIAGKVSIFKQPHRTPNERLSRFVKVARCQMYGIINCVPNLQILRQKI